VDLADAQSLLAVDTGALVIAPTASAEGLRAAIPATRLVATDLCAPEECSLAPPPGRPDAQGACDDDSCEAQVRDVVNWAVSTRVEPTVVLVAPNSVLDRVAAAETGTVSARKLTACRML